MEKKESGKREKRNNFAGVSLGQRGDSGEVDRVRNGIEREMNGGKGGNGEGRKGQEIERLDWGEKVDEDDDGHVAYEERSPKGKEPEWRGNSEELGEDARRDNERCERSGQLRRMAGRSCLVEKTEDIDLGSKDGWILGSHKRKGVTEGNWI